MIYETSRCVSNALGILILGESHLTEEFEGLHTKKEIAIDLDP